MVRRSVKCKQRFDAADSTSALRGVLADQYLRHKATSYSHLTSSRSTAEYMTCLQEAGEIMITFSGSTQATTQP
jgi:hypothetical protein